MTRKAILVLKIHDTATCNAFSNSLIHEGAFCTEDFWVANLSKWFSIYFFFGLRESITSIYKKFAGL